MQWEVFCQAEVYYLKVIAANYMLTLQQETSEIRIRLENWYQKLLIDKNLLCLSSLNSTEYIIMVQNCLQTLSITNSWSATTEYNNNKTWKWILACWLIRIYNVWWNAVELDRYLCANTCLKTLRERRFSKMHIAIRFWQRENCCFKNTN